MKSTIFLIYKVILVREVGNRPIFRLWDLGHPAAKPAGLQYPPKWPRNSKISAFTSYPEALPARKKTTAGPKYNQKRTIRMRLRYPDAYM